METNQKKKSGNDNLANMSNSGQVIISHKPPQSIFHIFNPITLKLS